ncbi:hypothetical protein H0H93_014899 [Arthromyces matolae]|nr:hypothetical protein H0H93_014899 [Arthromyces matolae]
MSRRPSRPTLRGTPHAPSSQVQVILPTPLATTLSRPLSIRRDGESDHMSLADKWVPVGRNDSTSPSSTSDTPSSSRRISPSMSTSPSSFTYFQSNSPPPPVPPKPKDAINPPLTS